jgi:hypothetical protein
LIRLIEGTGGGGSVKSILDLGASYVPFNPAWDQVVANLERVPVVSLLLGPVAGLGAARAVSSHYSAMVSGTSQMFIAGPPVVAGIGEDVTKEELGGADLQLAAGGVDDAYASRPTPWRRRNGSYPSCPTGRAKRRPAPPERCAGRKDDSAPRHRAEGQALRIRHARHPELRGRPGQPV